MTFNETSLAISIASLVSPDWSFLPMTEVPGLDWFYGHKGKIIGNKGDAH